MKQKLHKNARTTYTVRKEIKESTLSIQRLSNKLGLSWNTVKKWKTAESVEDRSSRPHKLNTTLAVFQEDLILFERKQRERIPL